MLKNLLSFFDKQKGGEQKRGKNMPDNRRRRVTFKTAKGIVSFLAKSAWKKKSR